MDNKEGRLVSEIQFKYDFLTDSRYTNSQSKSEIDSLAIPTLVEGQTKDMVGDLGIDYPLTIGVYIPEGQEKLSIIPTLGIGGRAIKDKEIKLFLDPDHENVVKSLRTYQERQIAHELNHTLRFHLFPNEPKTLGSALVSEGLATFYEENYDGDYKATPWGSAFGKDQLREVWKDASRQLGNPNYAHRQWFFGADRKYPVWTGYSLGNEIVRQFKLSHPDIQMREMTEVSTDEILHNVKF